MPIGLDLEPYRASERHRGRLRTELGVGLDTKLVGIVARLTAIKAHEVFLQAAATVRRQHPDTQFVVVGAGERQEELLQLADEYGLAPAVHWLGWRRDLPAVYADLDVVALTSRNEGLPTTLVEAMAAGRPVVGDAGGWRADVGDARRDRAAGRERRRERARGRDAHRAEQSAVRRAAGGGRARVRLPGL